MRLLVIAPDFPNNVDETPGGIFVKEQVMDLAKYFDGITVIAPQPLTFGRYPEIERMKEYSIGNVSVHYPRYFYLPIGWFRERIPKLHEKAVRRVIKERKVVFDLIHAHFTNPSGIVGISIKKGSSIPLILTIHENSAWFDRELGSAEERIREVWEGADLVLRAKKDDVEKLKRFNKNVHAVPIGFNSDAFKPIPKEEARATLGKSNDRTILFSLGNLIKRKGFEHLISAVKKLNENGVELDCYIAGSGEEAPRLRKLVSEIGLNEQVHFLGRITNEEKRIWMSSADLFVLPSLSESFGLVQLEAMACGTPVVATRNGGSEWIMNDDVGVLCEPGDPDDLANKIKMALERRWDREPIIEHARRYDWSRINAEIIDLVRRTVEKGNKS